MSRNEPSANIVDTSHTATILITAMDNNFVIIVNAGLGLVFTSVNKRDAINEKVIIDKRSLTNKNTWPIGELLALSILSNSSTIWVIVGLFFRSDSTHFNGVSIHVLISSDISVDIVAWSLFSQFSHTCKVQI